MAKLSLLHLAMRAANRVQSARLARQGKTPLHFLHIGKTGGTAIKYVLRERTDCDPYAIRLHYHLTGLRDIPRGDKAFFFLRDPVSRFKSGFFSRQRKGKPRHNMPWTPGERKAFERFDSPNVLALALSSSDAGERRAAEQAMRSISHVRDLYERWLGDESYLVSRASDIFFIGFQESLSEDFLRLKDKLGLPAEARLPEDDFNAHRSVGNQSSMLEEQAVVNLKEWYAADYRLLETCRQLCAQATERG